MNVNIENEFLDKLKNDKCHVTIITTNGYQMKCIIIDHDQDTILVDVYGQKQLVYKNAISTIIKDG